MKLQPNAAGMAAILLLVFAPQTIGAKPNPAEPAAEARREQATPTLVWGPVVDGLQAGLRLAEPRTTFAPGEPIWQETYLRNRSHAEVVVQAIGGYEEQGAPIITNARGSRVKVLRYFGMGAMFLVSKHVKPGELALVGRFAVAFRAPGRSGDRPREVAPNLSSSAEGMPLALAGQGSYVLRQDLTPMTADEKAPKKSLPTGAIPIQIAGAPLAVTVPVDHNHIDDLANAPIAWGVARSGLQAGVMVLGAKAHTYVGERVRLAVVLRNVSTQPIWFWHETSFAFLEPPNVIDAAGKRMTIKPAQEAEWRTLGEIRMTGVTFDMTFAPSADGPSQLRRSKIEPGQSVIGYSLTAFVAPPVWDDGHAAPGQYRVTQPLHVGLSENEQLDTSLESGSLNLTLYDPDLAPQQP